MLALVTGAAGFVGSNLVDALLARGDTVRGIDSFTPYYDPGVKRANLDGARASGRFELLELDLRTADLVAALGEADVVFHLAAQPGVRLSWAEGFAEYDSQNVLATQRLLEAARSTGIRRLVYASSSSVYGDRHDVPFVEELLPRPHSPYGVTKLAAEHLCCLYARNWDVPAVSLRYFTVYGPRQRPDMAIHRLVEAALNGTSFPLYGDGNQVRDFTFVDDVVAANLAAADVDVEPGTVVNVAGGSSIDMNGLIHVVADAAGAPITVDRMATHAGDVARTGGSIEMAERLLGWLPNVALADGVRAQVAWHRARRSAT